MVKRRDGLERKAAILKAATKVFAEKGFHDTTIADICREAKSNTASVNYYFDSKDRLYAEVWQSSFQVAMEKYPPNMNLPSDAPPQKQLEAQIRSFLHKVLDSGQLGDSGQILLMELANPTESIVQVKRDAIEPLLERIIAILRDLLGAKVPRHTVVFCAMSVIHQCLGVGLRRGQLYSIQHGLEISQLHEALSNHITQFSLAGVAEIRRQMDG